VTWRDAMGQVIKDDDKMMVKDTDLVIVGADWSHMGRSVRLLFYYIFKDTDFVIVGADWSHMGRSVPLLFYYILHILGDITNLRGLQKVGAMDELTNKDTKTKCHHLKKLTCEGTGVYQSL
jgi:hypothetical protein